MSAELQQDVLEAISNDYEHLETILLDLRNWHPDLIIEAATVVNILKQAILSGLANAYHLSGRNTPRLVKFEAERVNEVHFYITPEGKKTLGS
jgi:hypothetical protein